MKTPEGIVKSSIDILLKRYNVWYYKPVSCGYGKHGISDYICCRNDGRFFVIEVKAKDGMKPTDNQLAQLEAVTMAGGDAWLITPSWLEQLEKYLANNGYYGNMKLELEQAKWKKQQ